jgi:xanthine/uracil permease
MLENELSTIWLQSAAKEAVKFNQSELLADLNSQLKNFDKCLKKRDKREIIAASIVILIFCTGTILFTGIISKIGMLLCTLYGVVVIYVLRNVKKHKPVSYDQPVKDYLVMHREYLVKERNLLKNVIYWYLLPPFIGEVLFFIGQNMGTITLIISILIVFGINTYIYFLNKAGVKKVFDPLLLQIDKTIADF